MQKTKGMRFAFALVLAFSVIAFFPGDNFGADKSVVLGYKIEDISADIISDGAAIIVSGKIRNLRYKPIVGNVVIYMVDAGDGVIHLVETEVNDKRPILFGGVGTFEIAENVEGFELDSIANIFIDFVEK